MPLRILYAVITGAWLLALIFNYNIQNLEKTENFRICNVEAFSCDNILVGKNQVQLICDNKIYSLAGRSPCGQTAGKNKGDQIVVYMDNDKLECWTPAMLKHKR
jgi:hypothetical protein